MGTPTCTGSRSADASTVAGLLVINEQFGIMFIMGTIASNLWKEVKRTIKSFL